MENKEQQAAVLSGSSHILVTAGPGTGKTKTLSKRVLHLVQQRGLYAYSIWAISFTKKAAAELRQRIIASFEEQRRKDGKRVYCATFHSVCAKILREYGNRIGLAPGWKIITENQKQQLIQSVLRSDEMCRPSSVSSLFSSAKAANFVVPRDGTPLPPEFQAALQDFFKKNAKDGVENVLLFLGKCYLDYEKELRGNNCLDFDDLLSLCVKLLREHSDVRESYAKRMTNLLLDEFQDTNSQQLELVRLLSTRDTPGGPVPNNVSVFAVGDPDQLIYEWRGAQTDTFTKFAKMFPDVHCVSLNTNYRSVQSILDASCKVIGSGRSLVSAGPKVGSKRPPATDEDTTEEDERHSPPPPVVVRECLLASEEHEFVMNVIDELIEKEKRSLSDIAILYRNNHQKEAWEEALGCKGFDFQTGCGPSSSDDGQAGQVREFHDTPVVRAIASYLTLIDDPCNYIAFRDAISFPQRVRSSPSLFALARRVRDLMLELEQQRESSGPPVGMVDALEHFLQRECNKCENPKCRQHHESHFHFQHGKETYALTTKDAPSQTQQPDGDYERLSNFVTWARDKLFHCCSPTAVRTCEQAVGAVEDCLLELKGQAAEISPSPTTQPTPPPSQIAHPPVLAAGCRFDMDSDLVQRSLEDLGRFARLVDDFYESEFFRTEPEQGEPPHSDHGATSVCFTSASDFFDRTPPLTPSPPPSQPTPAAVAASTATIINTAPISRLKYLIEELALCQGGLVIEGPNQGGDQSAARPPHVAFLEASKQKNGYVTLSTIHAAKGLEWPVVFVAGVSNNIFRKTAKEGKVDEDRRLMFVAMTRAKHHLFLTNSLFENTPKTGDGQKPRLISSFLHPLKALSSDDSSGVVWDEPEEVRAKKKELKIEERPVSGAARAFAASIPSKASPVEQRAAASTPTPKSVDPRASGESSTGAAPPKKKLGARLPRQPGQNLASKGAENDSITKRPRFIPPRPAGQIERL